MMKGIVTVTLLVFVVVSVAYMAVGQRGDGNVAATNAEVAETAAIEPTQNIADDDVGMLDRAEHAESRAAAANPTSEAVAAPQAPTKAPRRVIAYYFHRTQRCHTCLTMEAYARAALEEDLSDALQSGELQFRSVNVDEPANEHFVNEYELYTSALVMVEMEGTEVKRSKKLEQIWDLVGDEWKFKTFVRDEALAYLEDAP